MTPSWRFRRSVVFIIDTNGARPEPSLLPRQHAGRPTSVKVRPSRIRPAVIAALHSRVTPHHRFLLRLHLTQIDALELAVRDVEARLGETLAPFQDAVESVLSGRRSDGR